ncbi:hypothetical protein MD484_g3925, partial [Candolleomyces efflorescens]
MLYRQQRGLYQGVANILYGLGAALGGPVGGWVNDKFGWRVAFYMQTPFFLFSMVVVATKVNITLSDEIQSQTLMEKVRRIDFLGSLTLVGSVGCLLLGFSLKSTEEIPWTSSSVLGLFFACAIFTAAFILVEKYWAPYPVMPLRLISQRTPLAVSLANLFASMSAFSMGLGMAGFITSTLIAMIAAVYRPDMAVATGITYLFRTTGQVLGVSLSGAVLQAVLLARLRGRIQGPDAEQLIHSIRHTTLIIPSLEPPIREAAIASYGDALRVVFLCQTLISILAFITCIPIQESTMPPPPPPSPVPQSSASSQSNADTIDSADSSNA